MRPIHKAFVALAVAVGLLVPYQNCTLHQSEARKYFDQNGFVSSSVSDCLPYIAANDVASIFSAAISASQYVNQNVRSCYFITTDNSTAAINSVVCSIDPAYKQNIFDTNGAEKMSSSDPSRPAAVSSSNIEWAHYADPNSTNFVGAWFSVLDNGKTILKAYGAQSSDAVGVVCTMTFLTSQEYTSDKSVGVDRLQRIIIEMVNNI